jgi:hypothetical protein
MPGAFMIAGDARGSLVHVRNGDGECLGCIEVGLYELYEIVRTLVLAETRGDGGADIAEGTSVPPPPRSDCSAAWR